jgi:hypothetical protein
MANEPGFPERADDGCTWCGTVLLIFNKDGSVDESASNAQQQVHQTKACVANPSSEYAEYVNKPVRSKGLSESEISELVEKRIAAIFAERDAATPPETDAPIG